MAVEITHTNREKQFLILLGLFLLAEIRISFDVDRANLGTAMAAISAAHNYETPMIIYQSADDESKAGKNVKAAEYVRGDIKNDPKAEVSMEKLAQTLTKDKLVWIQFTYFVYFGYMKE